MRDDNGQLQQDEQQQYEQSNRGASKMEKTEKEVRQVTPVGEAKWAHVRTPKAAFAGEGAPKYTIDVCFDKDDPAWKEWAGAVTARVKALPEQTDKRSGEPLRKHSPIKRELDKNDEPTGRFYVTFKTSDKFKPPVMDKFGDAIPDEVMIGNGSKVRVSYLSNVYDAFGGGINFYLNAVQVIDLVNYNSQGAKSYGFDVEVDPISTDPFDTPF